jgi:hypothetical protein
LILGFGLFVLPAVPVKSAVSFVSSAGGGVGSAVGAGVGEGLETPAPAFGGTGVELAARSAGSLQAVAQTTNRIRTVRNFIAKFYSNLRNYASRKYSEPFGTV